MNGRDLESRESQVASPGAGDRAPLTGADLVAERLLEEAIKGYEPRLADPGAGFERLRARIESSQAPRCRFLQWMRASHGFPGWIWALQGLVFVAICTWWLAGPIDQKAEFRTLTDTPASAGGRLVLQVVFEPDTSERELRETLAGERAEIVRGPSANGVYHLALTPHHVGDTEALLHRWQAHSVVRFAALSPGSTQ